MEDVEVKAAYDGTRINADLISYYGTVSFLL